MSEKWRKRVKAGVKTGKGKGEAGEHAVKAVGPFLLSPAASGRLVCMAALLLVAACSRSTDIAELAPATTIDPSTTASVQSAENTESEAAAASDKQAIASAIRDVKAGKPGAGDSMVLAWRNEETGNSGTITAIEKAMSDTGERCFSFLTTLESYTGISLYDGTACELSAGQWVLSWFKPKSIG
ncbi:MAG: RT0821/Lpp0805 family surface protein [Pseudomonadota bacterium]